jgi:hypothetical protein
MLVEVAPVVEDDLSEAHRIAAIGAFDNEQKLMAEAAQLAPAQVLGFLAVAGGARGCIPCFLKSFCVLFRFSGFRARCGLSNVWF